MNFSAKSKSVDPGFQLAPMVDVMFILLAFFVASQIFARWEKEIDIQLPTAVASENPRRLPGEIIINISKAGSMIINEKELGESDLTALLERIVGIFPGQPVLIRADRRTAYQHVIGVLDLCRQADIWNISFATSSE
jgi:biopolymer transport protein ExbD